MQPDKCKVAPLNFQCDPLTRFFPSEWKDIWFRRYSKEYNDGIPQYECPLCKKLFNHSNIGYLQGDHIWPYSMCGETSWANYRLICGSCNVAKRDYIDHSIRKLLGRSEFRQLVAGYLQGVLSQEQLESPIILQDILGSVDYKR